MLLEVVGKVQHRFYQDFLLAKQKSDQEATNASVAIEKRVNRLEPCVRQADLDEQRKGAGGGPPERYRSIVTSAGRVLRAGEKHQDIFSPLIGLLAKHALSCRNQFLGQPSNGPD